MLLVYTAGFVIIPIDCINTFITSLNPSNFINYSPYIFILHSMFILDIIFNFLTGYCKKRTRQIITQPGQIAKYEENMHVIFDFVFNLIIIKF